MSTVTTAEPEIREQCGRLTVLERAGYRSDICQQIRQLSNVRTRPDGDGVGYALALEVIL